jgi:hypothetical protein
MAVVEDLIPLSMALVFIPSLFNDAFSSSDYLICA